MYPSETIRSLLSTLSIYCYPQLLLERSLQPCITNHFNIISSFSCVKLRTRLIADSPDYLGHRSYGVILEFWKIRLTIITSCRGPQFYFVHVLLNLSCPPKSNPKPPQLRALDDQLGQPQAPSLPPRRQEKRRRKPVGRRGVRKTMETRKRRGKESVHRPFLRSSTPALFCGGSDCSISF